MEMLSDKKIKIEKKKIDSEKVRKTYHTLKALADRTRLKIINVFLERDNEELCVTDMANVLDTTVAAASYQLKNLEESGFLERTRYGKTICYKLDTENSMIETLKDFLK